MKSIFQQLHDPTTWPAPPERSLRPYSADFAARRAVPHAGGDPAAMDDGRESGE